VLRQLILSAVLATGTPTTPTPPPAESPQFEVLVERASGWQLHGTYRSHAEARQVAARIWREGYRVGIWEK
jgi:hypothetical protein